MFKHVNTKETRNTLSLAKSKLKEHWTVAKAAERLRFRLEFNAKWSGKINELIDLMGENCKHKFPPTCLSDVVQGIYTPRS